MSEHPKLHQARVAFQSNHYQLAKTICREICDAAYNNPDAWFMLGVISGMEGRYDDAARCFRETVKLTPDSIASWDNLGIALMHMGSYKQAEQCHKTAMSYNPEYLPAYNNLGNLMRITRRHPEAEEYFKSALRINPSYAEAHNNLAIVFREMNRHAESIQHFETAIQIRPDYASAHHNLADSLMLTGNLQGALAHYSRALELDPRLAETHASIAAIYEELNLISKARTHYDTAFRLNRNLVNAITGIARIMATEGLVDESLELLMKNCESHPDNPDINSTIATILIRQGKYEDAYHRLMPFLKEDGINSNLALAFATISRHLNQETTAIRILESLLQGSGVSLNQRELMEHALGRLYEGKMDFDKAFLHYSRGNSIRPVNTDLSRHLDEMESIRTVFSKDFLASCPRSTRTTCMPIFILGMPRSGTTLVEQILASHPDIHGGGELSFLWEITKDLPTGEYPVSVPTLTTAQLNLCAERYIEKLRSIAQSRPHVTDKLPHNFLHIGLIDMLFPDARIIHCVRDPRDTCVSIYSHKFNLNHIYARKLSDLGTYYRNYEELMGHWKEAVRIPLFDMHYEDLVRDFEHSVTMLLEFCGVSRENSCFEYYNSRRIVSTPSFQQVSRPIYSNSIARWKYFRTHLGPLLDALNGVSQPEHVYQDNNDTNKSRGS